MIISEITKVMIRQLAFAESEKSVLKQIGVLKILVKSKKSCIFAPPIDIKGSNNVKLGTFKITDEYEKNNTYLCPLRP